MKTTPFTMAVQWELIYAGTAMVLKTRLRRARPDGIELAFVSMTLPIEEVCDEDNQEYPNAGKIREILINLGYDMKELSLDYQNVHKNLAFSMEAIGYSPTNRERYKDVLHEEEILRKTYSDYSAKLLVLSMQKSGIETAN